MRRAISVALVTAGGIVAVLAAGRVRRRIAERRARIAAEEAAVEATRRRALLDPDWNAFERRTGRRAPEVLRRLYADAALVTAEDLVITVPDRGERPQAWEIASFAPPRAGGLADEWPGAPPSAFPFASNWYGDPYYVVLGERPDGDGPVYVRFHDAEDAELVAPSLAEFLSWPRHRAAPAGRQG